MPKGRSVSIEIPDASSPGRADDATEGDFLSAIRLRMSYF